MSTNETCKMNTFKIMKLIGQAPKELLDSTETGVLNSTETGVLMRMAVFGNKEGKNISPGVERISKTTKFCEKTIRATLKSLVKKEFLIICSDRKQGSRDKDCYEINIPLLQKITTPKNTYNKSYYNKPNLIIEPKKSCRFEVQEIFDYWQQILNRQSSKLDKKRYRQIARALESGFSVEALKKAIDGIKKSSFHMGNNDMGEIYNGLNIVFRDSGQIDKFISKIDGVNTLNKIEAMLFPEFADTCPSARQKDILLKLRDEPEINDTNEIYTNIPWIYKIPEVLEGNIVSCKRLDFFPQDKQKYLVYKVVQALDNHSSQILGYGSGGSSEFAASLNNTLSIWLNGLCDLTIAQIINGLLDVLNFNIEWQKGSPNSIMEFCAVCKRTRAVYDEFKVPNNYKQIERNKGQPSKILNEIIKKCLPLSKHYPSNQQKESPFTLRKEPETNEHG